MNNYTKSQSGYIALVSVLMLSAAILFSVLSISRWSALATKNIEFYERFVDTENQVLSCVSIARVKVFIAMPFQAESTWALPNGQCRIEKLYETANSFVLRILSQSTLLASSGSSGAVVFLEIDKITGNIISLKSE